MAFVSARLWRNRGAIEEPFCPGLGSERHEKIDTNPLLPFTCVDLMHIMEAEKRKPPGLLITTPEARCDRRVNARSTLRSHSSVPAPDMGREHAVDIREEKAVELADRGRVVKRPNDAVHNLRSALDYLAWQLVEVNGNTPNEKTCFCIGSARTGTLPSRE
jgi:hypothetical protein